MAYEDIILVLLAITLGTLGAIVYSLRVLLLLERRIARIDYNLERMVEKVLKEEEEIEEEVEKVIKTKKKR